jgi:hypothetical protein
MEHMKLIRPPLTKSKCAHCRVEIHPGDALCDDCIWDYSDSSVCRDNPVEILNHAFDHIWFESDIIRQLGDEHLILLIAIQAAEKRQNPIMLPAWVRSRCRVALTGQK